MGDELDSLLDSVPAVEESAEVNSPLLALAHQYPAAPFTDNGIKVSLVVGDTLEVFERRVLLWTFFHFLVSGYVVITQLQ